MFKPLNRLFLTAAIVTTPVVSHALPIDWHGVFGVDSTLISDFRRISSKTDVTSTAPGSQEVGLDSGNQSTASWQSYVFRLSPVMIINDAATFKGELSTGYANGGFLGDAPEVNQSGNNTASLYHHNKAQGKSVDIKKAYIELYSDTATYLIGRHSYHWGMGAIYNEGANAWDRHIYSRDGITMKLKIGNFHINPFWSKISNPGLTRATNAKEYGLGLLYDNDERDIAFGIHYAVKSSNSYNNFYNTSIETAPTVQNVGQTEVKVTDLYVKKAWGKFDIALEVPLVDGDLGRTNATGNITTFSAKAFLLQSNFRVNDSWTVGLDGGKVSGHDGSSSKFGALYLHPNYQVANLLFRYNLAAIGTPNSAAGAAGTDSVYDSYITNSMYLKLRSSYSTEKWTFDSAVIYAKAEEAAIAGRAAFNHTKNRIFSAIATQDDYLGTEIDLNATYRWNNEVSIGAGLGYLMTGDYFSYTNTAGVTNEAENSLLLQVNTAVTF